MAEGFAMEADELGMIALVAVLLAPGVVWIARGKSTAAIVGRTALVGGLIAAAVTIEAAMDKSVAELAE